MTEHKTIERRNLSGYFPQQWCAICGKAVGIKKNAAYVRCEGGSECSKFCHSACLNGHDTHMCSDTKEPRTEHGIEDAVTYRRGHSSAKVSFPPSIGEEGDERDADDVQQHPMGSDKEELVSSVVRLLKEVGKCDKIMKSHRL